MALSISTAQRHELAHYFHASLTRFSSLAVQEITRRFHRSAEDSINTADLDSLLLSFDSENHIFALTCRNSRGCDLDALLARTILNYVASEDVEAIRFPEASYGDPFDDCDPDLEEIEEQPTPQQPIEVHALSFDGINTYGKAKAFRLRELPPALQCRAKSRDSTADAGKMITLRHVKWDQGTEMHMFNGNIGEQFAQMPAEDYEDLNILLELVDFKPILRTIINPPKGTREAPPRRWEFIGEEPTVSQWLAGVGETRQVDPDAEPEIAKDALKFSQNGSMQQPTTGRIRMPKGVSFAALQARAEDQEQDRSEAQANNAFSRFLMGRTGADSASESEESEEVNSEASQEKATDDFFSRMKRKARESPSETIKTPTPHPEKTTAATRLLTTKASTVGNLQNDSATTPLTTLGTSTPDHGFPSYNRRYAKVDTWGLTGDAKNQAIWENENAAPLSARRRNDSGFTYEQLKAKREANTSVAGLGNSSQNPQPVVSKTPMSYRETPFGGDEPWAHKKVPPTVPTGNLVDIADPSVGGSRREVPKFPPGLFPPLGSERAQTKPQQPSKKERGDGTQSRVAWKDVSTSIRTQSQPQELFHGDLVDLGSSPEKSGNRDLIQLGEDQPIVERVQTHPEGEPRLFHTMRQQAKGGGKKQKKKSKGTSVSKSTTANWAVLDRPSPPPAPKVPKTQEPKESGRQGCSNTSDSDQKTAGQSSASDVQLKIDQHLAPLLTEGTQSSLTVRFGLILLPDADKLANTKALRLEDLRSKLEENTAKHSTTVFRTALGRERSDGAYLLRLPATLPNSNVPLVGYTDAWSDTDPHALQASTVYEFSILVPGGGEWTITFDPQNSNNATVSPSNAQRPIFYVHYPAHVWDAHLTPTSTSNSPTPDAPLQTSITTFLESLHTPPRPPTKDDKPNLPHLEAHLPPSAFSVSRAHAKRRFSQLVAGRGTWLVEQVWDLHVLTGARGAIGFVAKEERVMRKEGRVWWEAGLQVEKAEGLEGTLGELVGLLEDVGFEECDERVVSGRKEGKKRAEGKEYVPFW